MEIVSAEHVERLAHHALRGEAWEKAARYASEAGQRRQRAGAPRGVASFEQALRRLPAAADTRPTGQAIDLRLDLRPRWCLSGDSRVWATSARRSPSRRPWRRPGPATAMPSRWPIASGGSDRSSRDSRWDSVLSSRHPGRGSRLAAIARLTLDGPVFARQLSSRQSPTSWSTSRWNRGRDLALEQLRQRMRLGRERGCSPALAQVGRFPEAIARGTEAVRSPRRLTTVRPHQRPCRAWVRLSAERRR